MKSERFYVLIFIFSACGDAEQWGRDCASLSEPSVYIESPLVPAPDDSTTTNKAKCATDIERISLFSYVLALQES
jgi:hypothetical protein